MRRANGRRKFSTRTGIKRLLHLVRYTVRIGPPLPSLLSGAFIQLPDISKKSQQFQHDAWCAFACAQGRPRAAGFGLQMKGAVPVGPTEWVQALAAVIARRGRQLCGIAQYYVPYRSPCYLNARRLSGSLIRDLPGLSATGISVPVAGFCAGFPACSLRSDYA